MNKHYTKQENYCVLVYYYINGNLTGNWEKYDQPKTTSLPGCGARPDLARYPRKRGQALNLVGQRAPAAGFHPAFRLHAVQRNAG